MTVMTSKIQQAWRLSPPELQNHQFERLVRVIEHARDRPFYRDRLAAFDRPIQSWEEFRELPLLSKSDLIPAEPGHPARIFDLPATTYCRFHQTSGTSGHPLPVLDTAEDWNWWLDCWDHVLLAADVSAQDTAMMAFSFGPFIGFWTANDALIRRGTRVIAGGGMTSEQRLRMIVDHGCSIVCCTPTYALHLIAIAQDLGISLPDTSVRALIVAGEPGGCVAAVRARIETGWGAQVMDHAGASEIGAWGFGSFIAKGLHVIESEFIAELLRFDEAHPAGIPAGEGEPAELVLTSLGRTGGPAIRYRTGDIVRGFRDHDFDCRFVWLNGGVIGRADDMMVIRGVNVFPSSIESIVREVELVGEFQIIVDRKDDMDQLEIRIETDVASAKQIADRFRDRLSMRVPVHIVDPGTLPRSEAKSRRLIDRR